MRRDMRRTIWAVVTVLGQGGVLGLCGFALLAGFRAGAAPLLALALFFGLGAVAGLAFLWPALGQRIGARLVPGSLAAVAVYVFASVQGAVALGAVVGLFLPSDAPWAAKLGGLAVACLLTAGGAYFSFDLLRRGREAQRDDEA